ncbi:hypothetical protein, partial [Streptomyces sp. MK37H]|uniref:hypothetical protein n=1 Tax=Streptomyces sp. MK37H TaxID=2699117 RepID=UPI001B386279
MTVCHASLALAAAFLGPAFGRARVCALSAAGVGAWARSVRGVQRVWPAAASASRVGRHLRTRV